MERLFLLIVLAMPVWNSFGQKIQGVYVGNIFSERNALILEADDNQVTGAVYINEKDHFNFSGTYNKPELKGSILLDSGKKIGVEGSLKGNFLNLTFPDSSKMKICAVHKVSTKVAIDMADLFSNQYDMLLLGVWEKFKETDAVGNETTIATLKSIKEFRLYGGGAGRLSGTVPPNIGGRNYTAATASAAISAARWEIIWETHDGLLDETESPNVHLQIDLTIRVRSDYFIKNDTLVTRDRKKNDLRYWKRKK